MIGWAGMRGSVSLAAALALPLADGRRRGLPGPRPDHPAGLRGDPGDAGGPGPDARRRSSSGSGSRDDGSEEREEVAARVRLAEAALARIEELRGGLGARPTRSSACAGMYDYRRRRFAAREDGDGDHYEERTGAYQRLMYELFDAQREELIGMRNRGEISDEVRRRVERELDLEESRLMQLTRAAASSDR